MSRGRTSRPRRGGRRGSSRRRHGVAVVPGCEAACGFDGVPAFVDAVDATPLVCEDHAVEPGRVCETCETIFAVRFDCRCGVCGQGWLSASDRHFVSHPAVHGFLHDHGYDPLGHEWLRVQAETIETQYLVSEEPTRIRTVLASDGDELTVTLDGGGDVVTVDAGSDQKP